LSSDGSGDTTLSVGTNGQVLVVDSAASNGIKWADQTDLSSPGPIGATTPSTGEFTDLSASDNLILNGLYKVRFVISVKNDGGTIKHRTNRLLSQNSAGLSNFPTQVSGLSSTYTATPLLSSSVDFAGGAGLQNSSTATLIFNWINAQPSSGSDSHIIPTIVYNDTGTYYLAHGVGTNHNVNGTTQERQSIFLYNNSGSQISFNTTNIPTGKQVIFAVDGWVK